MTALRSSLFIFLLSALAGCAGKLEPSGELPRDRLVLRSALSVRPADNSVTLPLFKGRAGNLTVWYIVMDSSDQADAERRGVVWAPLLARAGHVQPVQQSDGDLVFAAAPDFAPKRHYGPGPQGFPPLDAKDAVVPGATAPAGYSPFIRLAADGPVLNAPIVAVGDEPFDLTQHERTMDRVLAIDTARRQVTLLLSRGFAEGRAVLYISTEANDPLAAVLERATLVPKLGEGDGDIGLIAFVNGQTGAGNPEAQGLPHLVLDGAVAETASRRNAARLGAPGNILTAFPTGKTASGYSPLWSVSLAAWAEDRVKAGSNIRITHQAEIYRLLGKGINGPDSAAFAPSGIVVNCPVIAYLDAAPP